MLQRAHLTILVIIGLIFAIIAIGPAMAQTACKQDAERSGTITGSTASVGFIAGVKWGSGVLTLADGRTFNFNFNGLKLLSTGASAVEFEGEIYNLKKIEDFIGVYYGAAMGVKLVKSLGPGEFAANNSKCVILTAKSKGGGIELNPPGPVGFYIQLAE